MLLRGRPQRSLKNDASRAASCRHSAQLAFAPTFSMASAEAMHPIASHVLAAASGVAAGVAAAILAARLCQSGESLPQHRRAESKAQAWGANLLGQLMAQDAFLPAGGAVSEHPLLICVGHGRTGTTSLQHALETLGLRADHYGRRTMELVRIAEGCGVGSEHVDLTAFEAVDAVS